MNCDKTLELLSAELDGRLSETEHAGIAGPSGRMCADCRRVYGTLRDVDAMLPETQLEPPKALHDAVMRGCVRTQRSGSRKTLGARGGDRRGGGCGVRAGFLRPD